MGIALPNKHSLSLTLGWIYLRQVPHLAPCSLQPWKTDNIFHITDCSVLTFSFRCYFSKLYIIIIIIIIIKKLRRQEENGTYERYQREQKRRQRIKRVKKVVWLFNTQLSYQLVCVSKFQKVWIQVWSKNRVRFKLHCRSADKKKNLGQEQLKPVTLRFIQGLYKYFIVGIAHHSVL